MMEQVEFSNVVVLNKKDLVDKDQQQDILNKISLLNPKARVVKSTQSRINVKEILNTRLFNRADVEENSIMMAATKVDASTYVEPEPECCTRSIEKGKKKCCKSKAKNDRLVDSGMSQVLLGIVSNNNTKSLTRHEKRFGITSFIYRARRPFHPVRLNDGILEPYFMEHYEDDAPVLRSHLSKLQKQASSKQEKRVKFMGELLRSKGFIWIATTNFILGGWQQAGNILRLEAEGHWLCETREAWVGTPSEELVRKDLTQENGEEYPYGDRRQELVFIGMKLDHLAIQKALDECLLTDEEMNMGPEKWQETWYEEDKIQLSLEDEDDEEEEDDEDVEDDEDENKDEEEDKQQGADSEDDTEGPPIKRSKK